MRFHQAVSKKSKPRGDGRAEGGGGLVHARLRVAAQRPSGLGRQKRQKKRPEHPGGNVHKAICMNFHAGKTRPRPASRGIGALFPHLRRGGRCLELRYRYFCKPPDLNGVFGHRRPPASVNIREKPGENGRSTGRARPRQEPLPPASGAPRGPRQRWRVRAASERSPEKPLEFIPRLAVLSTTSVGKPSGG